MKKKVDIIISCFNEECNISPFYDEIIKYFDNSNYLYNILFVNDGSSDHTYEKIIEVKNESNSLENIKVSYISFVKNFGHEAAMCAGLDKSNADYLIFMDADLQNPPSKIKEILDKFEEGADCVLLRRIKYESASFMKKITSNGYYLFSKIVLRNKNARNVSDFFAINSDVAKRVRDNYKTRLRFIRSFVQKESKNLMFVNYENSERFSGVSRYNYLNLTKLAIISELSRSKFLRDKYKVDDKNFVYLIDEGRSLYE